MKITRVTRTNIIRSLKDKKVGWSGDLDDIGFLRRIWDLSTLPSFDHRFIHAKGDIWQHRLNIPDWDDDWIYSDSRFKLIECSDDRFLSFLTEMLHPEVRADRKEADALCEMFNKHLEVDGYEIAILSYLSGKPIYAPRRKILDDSLDTARLKYIADDCDAPYLVKQITRLELDVSDSSYWTIGEAKNLMETWCKTIACERGMSLDSNLTFPQLVREVCKNLNLVPGDIPSRSKGEDSSRKILGGISQVVQGLAELRNLYGSGHGKDAKSKELPLRHGKLAADIAIAFSTFLFVTHREDD